MDILKELQEALEIVNGKTESANNQQTTQTTDDEEVVQVTNTTSLKIKSGSGC